MIEQVSPESGASATAQGREPQASPRRGSRPVDSRELLFYGMLLSLLAAPSVTNVYAGAGWGLGVAAGAWLIWLFVGSGAAWASTMRIFFYWGLAGMTWQIVYFLRLWLRL